MSRLRGRLSRRLTRDGDAELDKCLRFVLLVCTFFVTSTHLTNCFFSFFQMICKNIGSSSGTITSNDIREAVYQSLPDGRLKDGALKAGNNAIRTWLATDGQGNHCDWELESSSSSSSSNTVTSTNTMSTSSSDEKYSDDTEEMEMISSSATDKLSNGETLSSDDTSVTSSDYDPDYSSPPTTETDTSEPYEYDSEYVTNSSD